MSEAPTSRNREMVTVEIMGEEYTLRSDTSPEYTRKVADHVNRVAAEVRQQGGVMDPRKIAILAALTVTDQMFRVKDGVDRVRGIVDQRAEKLTRRVLEVVESTPAD